MTPSQEQKMRLLILESHNQELAAACKNLNPRYEIVVKPLHGRTALERQFDDASDKAYWRKQYLAKEDEQARSLQQRELEMLSAVATEQQHMPHVATFRGIGNATNTAGIEVSMPDYGPTLDDWIQLVSGRVDGHDCLDHPWTQAVPRLALLRAVIRALQEMHALNFLHCDVKLDNICAPLHGRLKLKGNHVLGCIDLNKLTLIDLGFSLKREPKSRYLFGNPPTLYVDNPAPPARPYVSPQYLEAARAAQRGEQEPFQNLDWRIDLFSLAAMVETLNKSTSLNPHRVTQQVERYLIDLPGKLRALHDMTDAQVRALRHLPHQDLINEIDLLIGLGRKLVYFDLDLDTLCGRNGNCILAVKEILGLAQALEEPGPEPKPWRKIVSAVAVAGMAVALAWTGRQISIGESLPGLTLPDRLESAGLDTLTAWPQHPGAKGRVELQPGKSAYAIGDHFQFTATSHLSGPGYLTVFAIDADPAQQQNLTLVMRNQKMRADEPVTFPGDLEAQDPSWQIKGPPGSVPMLALVTSAPIEWRGLKASAADQPASLPVLAYRNEADISALFNCAAQTGDAAQQCQAASQNYALSKVIRYQVIANPKM